jgi:hypothetical protein
VYNSEPFDNKCLIISRWYNPKMLPDLDLNDVIRMRKPHPCGGFEWRVVRLGADIGLVCMTCGRRIMLDRRSLRNRMKTIVSKAEVNDAQE